MPNVGGVQYPYTPQGAAAAQQAQAGLDPARMSPPLTSPSHPMAQRQTQDLTPYVPSYPDWTPADSAQWHELSNRMAYSSPHGYQGEDMGWSSSRSPSDPSVRYPAGYSDMRATRPIAQAPRGQMIETTDPGVGYGNSPSNPNWGQERGGSVGRMGPMNAPVSANYSAISPSNRIAGNIAAVMQGRQGPSPSTSPYLNQSGRLESPPNARPWTGFGPTGQPVPSRQPVQKGIPRG